MAQILVTGGTGYIGSKLIPALREAGHSVRLLARTAPAIMPAKLEVVAGDIRDAQAVAAAVKGCSHVVHLAGVPDGQNKDVAEAINTGAFPALIAAAGAEGARLIFMSSSALYGAGAAEECREDSPLKPLSPYASQKLAGEQMLAASALDYTIIRPGAVCGMAPAMRMDVLSHLLVRDACTKGTITVAGGSHARPHLHVSDLARAVVLLLDHPAATRAVFNLASDNLTIMALAEQVKHAVGPQVQIHEQPTTDTRSYRISSEKIHKQTGFSPLFHVGRAIEEVRDAIQSGAMSDPYDLRYYPSKRPLAA